MANCRIKMEKAYCEKSSEEEKGETFLPYLEGNTHQRNFVSNNNQGLKSGISLLKWWINIHHSASDGDLGYRKVFPHAHNCVSSSLVYAITSPTTVSGTLVLIHRKRKHCSLRFLNLWIINEKHFSRHLNALFRVLFPHPVLYMHACWCFC